ncbi:Spx/MgsR family RNA polymerase-binding regulatory protein [Thiomicrospira pelophila]|uniref:Spx/MgsR family RNA polymerase-binding regulatory protein n=1 Tax=Thiomicrospira pelophila TaxID=934 RepID=UPI000A55830D|nr:Spx/MgsR family RNA polymerase-binding regulatory protein [Thiomicrospira pelophila]
MMILYGISNCDTVRKARKYLESAGHNFQLHDFRKDGLTTQSIQSWLTYTDYSNLINKRSTSWKQLSDDEKLAIENKDLDLLTQYPTLIKRPVLQLDQTVLIGFKLEEYQKL